MYLVKLLLERKNDKRSTTKNDRKSYISNSYQRRSIPIDTEIFTPSWDAISPIFKFSSAVRKVIYTTNAIESLNATYRKLNRQLSVFPSDNALLKALYLSTFEATKKWTMPIRNWGQIYGELSIMYEERLPE